MNQIVKEKHYREIQFIWQTALHHIKKNRHGLAIELFNEGIKLSIEYNDSRRLYQLYRDCGDAYIEIGDYDKALDMFYKAKRFDSAGRLLFGLNNINESLDHYLKAEEVTSYPVDKYIAYVLFYDDRYIESLERLESWCRKLTITEYLAGFTRNDCIIAFIGLCYKYGIEHLKQKRKAIEYSYKRVYKAIIKKFGNWKSAIVLLSNFITDNKVFVLKQKLKPKLTTKEVDLLYTNYEVDEILHTASILVDIWESVFESICNSPEDNYDSARKQIYSCIEKYNLHRNHLFKEYYIDLFILENKFEEAIYCYKQEFSCSVWNNWDKYLNLLLLANKELSGQNLAIKYNYLLDKSTAFLAQHQDEFIKFCDKQLLNFKNDNKLDLLKWIAKKYKNEAKYSLGLFIGSDLNWLIKKSPFSRYEGKMYLFSNIHEMENIIKMMLSDAENKIRVDLGLPKVGEGWISEIEMLSYIKKELSPYEVIHQGSPKWLGLQKFDAYIPELKLAVEYQGVQHYKPIDIFGGEKGLEETQFRDKIKLEIAKHNGVAIEYVKYDEDIQKRVKEIALKYK